MSRFITDLKKAAGATPTPMGFHRVTAAFEKPHMLLVAEMNMKDYTAVPAVEGSVNATLFPSLKSSPAAKQSTKSTKSAKGIPWGIKLTDTGEPMYRPLMGQTHQLQIGILDLITRGQHTLYPGLRFPWSVAKALHGPALRLVRQDTHQAV